MGPKTKIYKAYFELKTLKLYYNQIKDYTKLSHSSLQNQLKKLVEQKVLVQQKTKGNVFFIIKDKKFMSLKFSELALMNFRNLNTNIKIPLDYFLTSVPNEVFTIVLFGSASRKEETKKSDVDLLVVYFSKVDLKTNEERFLVTSKHNLSLFECSLNDFKESKDPIITQARKTGFPIHNEQKFYEEIINEY